MLFAIIISLVIFINKSRIVSYKRYSASIIVESTLKDDASKKIETIELKDDGKIAEVSTSFIKAPIYIDKEGIFYENSGRFNKIVSDYSYRNIYKILADTFKDYRDGNYHPELTKDTINKLLSCLFIDYEINRDAVGNLTIKNGRIEEFSLYLRNFYGYEKVGFVVTFENLDKNYKINSPTFYEDAIDEVDDRILRIVE